MAETVTYCQGHPITRPQTAKKANPWPGNPNAYECPWGCNGTGDLPWFNHIQGGVCFNCRGEGWILGRGHQQTRERPINEPRRRWQRQGDRVVQIG